MIQARKFHGANPMENAVAENAHVSRDLIKEQRRLVMRKTSFHELTVARPGQQHDNDDEDHDHYQRTRSIEFRERATERHGRRRILPKL